MRFALTYIGLYMQYLKSNFFIMYNVFQIVMEISIYIINFMSIFGLQSEF
jgi:hypothetical protein